MNRTEIFSKALELNGDDKKYQVTVDGDKIITRVKWMDATFFSTTAVSDEVKEFEYVVQIHKNGKYSELTKSTETTKGISAGGASYRKKGFIGKEITFNKTVGLGKDNIDGSVGVVEATFNSEEYKKPVRDLLKENGCKKKMGKTAKIFIVASVIAVILIIAAVALLINIANKKAIDADTFRAEAEESGYYVTNDTRMENMYDEVESVVIAVEEGRNYQIDFYVFVDAETAKGLFEHNKAGFKNAGYNTTSSVSSTKYDNCTFSTDDSYRYIARIDNTMLYIDVDKEYKNEVKSFVDKIGY